MKRADMRKIREVLRLLERGLSHRAISATTDLSKGTVSSYRRRALEAGVTWTSARELDDASLESKMFHATGQNLPPARVPIDFEWTHRELRRTGVTLQFLWIEYCEACAGAREGRRPYSYSQFCDRYRSSRERVDVTMRQVHRAGEKLFIDYSGQDLRYHYDPSGNIAEIRDLASTAR